MKPTPKRRKDQGFTLVEVLMVLLIVSVLAGMVLGLAGIANKKAAISKAEVQIQQLKNILADYKLEFGAYPETGSGGWEEIKKGNDATDDLIDDLTAEGYVDIEEKLDDLYQDPWGNPYDYNMTTGSSGDFRLRSRGADGLATDNPADPENEDNIPIRP